MNDTVTHDQAVRRHAFADALEHLATLADSVPTFGFDVPARHIAAECRRWATGYRRPGLKRKEGAAQ